jgi:hypothetical protein
MTGFTLLLMVDTTLADGTAALRVGAPDPPADGICSRRAVLFARTCSGVATNASCTSIGSGVSVRIAIGEDARDALRECGITGEGARIIDLRGVETTLAGAGVSLVSIASVLWMGMRRVRGGRVRALDRIALAHPRRARNGSMRIIYNHRHEQPRGWMNRQ